MAYEGLRQIFGPSIKRKIRRVRGEANLPQRPPFIIAINHVGYLDAFVLSSFIFDKYHLHTYFFTVEKMWRMWGEYLARHWLRMIPVYNNNKKYSLVEATAIIEQRGAIGIFPEGTRNVDNNNLIKGKTGTVRIAMATGVPLIPIGLVNNTGYGIGEAFASLWQKDKFVDIFIGQPIDLIEFKNQPIDKPLLEAATRKLMLAIGDLCGKAYSY